MTNFVKLHCMTAEKLAEWLSKADKCGEGPWWKWFSDTYCKQCDEKNVFSCDDTGKCAFDDSPKAVVLGWLESEYVEADSHEVKRET